MKTQPRRRDRTIFRELEDGTGAPARVNAFCGECNIIDTNLRNYCVGTYGGCKLAWMDYEYKREPK
jgi:hypothetical protein